MAYVRRGCGDYEGKGMDGPMKISVITPVYEGNMYMPAYLRMIGRAVRNFGESVEVILVNDSPWEPIVIPYVDDFQSMIKEGLVTLRILKNRVNCGIQRSRIHGILASTGDYILMLDQDDAISDNSLRSLAGSIGDYDMCLGNGWFEMETKKEPIYGNRYSQLFAATRFAYEWIRDFIVSPGQCLIRKSSIPKDWIKRPMKYNGADDYYLWLLMFGTGCRITCCYEKVYTHKYTGNNLSLNDEKMFLSEREMLYRLSECETYPVDTLKFVKRRIFYKKIDRTKKMLFVKASIKNLDIFTVNVMYRLIWRGALVK